MSFLYKPIRIVIILVILFSIFLSETKFTGAPSLTSALTDEQRREIEKLRAELNDAFEKDDEESVAEKGVIVQPGWTQDSKPQAKVDAKVIVTDEGLKEAKKLRAEINRAVTQDVYVANVDGDTKTIKKLEKQLGLKERGRDVLENILSSTAERATANVADEHVGSAFDDLNDDDTKRPNVVDAMATLEPDIDVRKLQRLEVGKRRTKEMLVLKSIEEDYSFNLGDDIDGWAHIIHNGEEYFIGRRPIDLLIIQKDEAQYRPGKVLHVGEPITYLEAYSYWNLEQHQQEGVILVASNDKVLWYRGNPEAAEITLYWEWVIGTTITGLTYFTAENNEYLAVSSNVSSRTGFYALNIYQFELHTREFWIAQRLQLEYACGEVTFLDTGRDIILAVPQNNSAAIYTFNPHADATDHIRFQLRRTFESESIDRIAAFQMGGRNYLALGGHQPQILLYQQGDFVPKTILGNNFGFVELFFPIPVRTYRDDLILLVQHRVDFGTHGVTVLETLIWDGEAFEASIPVPCQLGEHTVYGVSCMLDIQRDEGLKGAALLRRGDEVSIIVPRHNTESGLFRLHTELLAKNSELLDLQEIFTFLQDWVKEQDDFIAQAQTFLATPDSVEAQSQPDYSNLEQLITPELHFTGDVGEIHVNDYKWTDEDTQTDLDFVLQAIERLEHDLNSGRQRRDTMSQELSFDQLDFDHLEVENLLIDKLNNEPFYIQDGALNFDGILNLQNLEVLQQVLARETRQALQMLELNIGGDFEFTEINDVPWSQIRENLVFRNAPLELPKLEVEGEVVVEDNLSIDVLNSLNFPDDYLWSSGPASSIIQAEKTFTNTLTGNSVDTEGLINGVNPFNAISLSDAQDWAGLPTFAHLEVSEKLELNGTAHGRGLDDLPSNPTLEETHIISAACHFEHLEVLGDIHLNGNLDKQPLGPILSDVVLLPADPEEEITINSKKTFATIEFPVDFHVVDSAVNGIAVDQFVTLHTKQDLDLNVIEGYVYFSNLSITGTYDGVEIEELLKNSIKIDEPQTSLGTQLNFVDVVKAESVHVLTNLNGVIIANGYQTAHEDLSIPDAHFEHLNAKIADMPNDIVGPALLNGLNLRSFLEKRSWSEPADTGNIFLDELILADGFETDELHGLDAAFILNFLDEIDDLPEMILDGKVQVDHIIVTGDVQANKLNGHNFDEDIQLTVVWLNRPNYLSTNLKFIELLEVCGDLVVEGDYNGSNLPDLIDDMVFRTPDGTTLILAPKSFVKNVNVRGNTKVDAINSVPFTEIATKQTISNYRGTLQISGNLIVHALELSGHFNVYPMSSLSSLVRYDQHLHAFVLLGEIPLQRQLQLEDLTVYGNLNDISQLSDFFEQLVYKNSICMLKGKNTFTGRVSIEKGAYIRSLNGYNLIALLNNMVFIRDAVPVVIKAPVTFGDVVQARDVTVRGSLSANTLNGCALEEWINETLRVDLPQKIIRYLPFVPGCLDGNSIYVSYLNDIDLSQLITLHTEQNLSSNLFFSEVYLDGKIYSQESVNDVDLQMEYANTLLIYGNQHITTPLTMPSVTVLNNLQINAPVNSDKDFQQLAKLDGNLEFESPLFFQNVSARNLHTSDLVSGINLNQWFTDTLWLNDRPQQWITGNWSVRSLNVKSGPEVSTIEKVDYVRALRNDDGYEELCKKVTKLLRKQQKRVYFLKHLEKRFAIDMGNSTKDSIHQVFAFSDYEQNYLLVNMGCVSSLYAWNITQQIYDKVNSFETGKIDQFVFETKPYYNSTKLFVTNTIGKDKQNCTYKGLNSWLFDGTNFSHLQSFEQKVMDIQVSSGTSPKLYGLNHNTLYEISLDKKHQTNRWNISEHLSYHFIPHAFNSDYAFTNNRRPTLTLKNERLMREKRSLSSNLSIPINQEFMAKYLRSPSESILKPNATLERKLTFSDFKQVIERILDDLIYRLHLEVNITQLSIPESDLYDEHLAQDFLDIMQELKKQQIIPVETFGDINVETLETPENPAQVLAARTVQIIWPVIVEIEEIHQNLRDNDTHEHPVCAGITSSLGETVRDVLLLANKVQSNATTLDYTKEFTAVIERIRKFQTNLEDLNKKLNAKTQEDLKEDIEVAESELVGTTATGVVNLPNATLLRLPLLKPLESNISLIHIENMDLVSTKVDEIISLVVGPTLEPMPLFAITSPNTHLVDSIKLYLGTPKVNASLFQTIGAHKPRALTTLRIRDETLLIYVEDCCSVHIKLYRGVQGFVDFAKFKTDGKIVKLLSLQLPYEDDHNSHFLVTVLQKKIVFYEVVVAGVKNITVTPIKCD